MAELAYELRSINSNWPTRQFQAGTIQGVEIPEEESGREPEVLS